MPSRSTWPKIIKETLLRQHKRGNFFLKRVDSYFRMSYYLSIVMVAISQGGFENERKSNRDFYGKDDSGERPAKQ
jgi:hypothetical protein